ncbi:carboxylesterase/lipase family protein [Pseudomonas gingeri]|uniref:carboxylesterase/lipase family protein n=1 Tax=Pseudomonas gingeri TaxID=117681 RepID=UPI0015A18E41|nr:carboxylesterase family protein [Pseudomonas gingeri]NWD70001.1 carboxylesterase/lipase family protein [Pseudomonas gingeri]NWD77245.1 carboxylesterase/lipase family protein [Pseudomonas gingeri]
MSSNEPVVETKEGLVQGGIEGRMFVFKGIPYAAPPLDNLRWRAPEPVTKWPDIYRADHYGPANFQNAKLCEAMAGGNPGPLSENCLYLNVWTPRLDKDAELPVMVWIHGGGYLLGAGGLPPYIGAPLASRQVVVVSINYRLGHLGFFAHPALDRENGGVAVCNFALLDQMAALEWVQRNIAGFGGDPHNVTLFGQSAGGRSVLSLFAAPQARGLFHKGIAQSVYGLPDSPRKDALERGVKFADCHKLGGAGASAERLRQLPAEHFWALDPALAPFGGPVPISGDTVLPKPILEVFEQGEQALLPLIIGNNSDDSSILNDFGFSPIEIIEALTPEQYEWVKGLYPGLPDDEELGRQVGRDLLFSTMAYVIVEAHRAKGAASWRYYFEYVAEQSRPGFPHGARHGDEIAYVLDTGAVAPPQDQPLTEPDQAFARRVSAYWLAFAHLADGADSIETPGEVAWKKHKPLVPGLLVGQAMRFGKDVSDGIALEDNFMALRVLAFAPLLKDLGALLP